MTWLRTLHLNKLEPLKSHWDKLIVDGRTLTKVSMSGKKNLNKLYCDLVNSNMLLMSLWNGLEELTRPWTPSNQSMAIPKSLKLSWLNSKLWSMISKLIKAVWIRWMMLVVKSSNLEKVCSFFFSFFLIHKFGVENFFKVTFEFLLTMFIVLLTKYVPAGCYLLIFLEHRPLNKHFGPKNQNYWQNSRNLHFRCDFVKSLTPLFSIEKIIKPR